MERLFVFLGLASSIFVLAASNTGKDEIINEFSAHFIGVYAFEATPYWPEFKIVNEGGKLVIQSSNSEMKLPAIISEGVIIAKENDNEVMKLACDSSKERYTLFVRTQVSTQTGIEIIPEAQNCVKVKSSPNDQLVKEYGVTAADLVRKVRDSEDWIHQVSSFYVKGRDKWFKTPEEIEHRTRQLKAQFPDMAINSDRFSDLRSETVGEINFCYDATRFRTYKYTEGDSIFLQIWNGREYVAHEKYLNHNQECYAFRKEIPEFNNILIDLMWPRSKQHSFWWQKKQMENWEDFYGRAEQFILVGKKEYRGVSCYEVECRPRDYNRVRRWFIGIKDQLKYGDLTYEEGQLTWEQWLGEYKEIQPGCWFPMAQGYHIFERDKNRKSFIASTRNIKVEDARVNESLSEDIFVMDFKDGVDVNDDRFGGFVTYQYKKDRTEEEWMEIHQKAHRRQESDLAEKQALDERIGQPAPAFSAECKWLNTEPLMLEKMHGKAVILQFWAVSCGPCHGYMNMLKKKPQDENIIVLGVHIPEQNLDKIKQDMDKYKADGPVVVDVGQGWGEIHNWYQVKRVPYWIVIGPDGKTAGHADHPSTALKMAQKLMNTISKTN